MRISLVGGTLVTLLAFLPPAPSGAQSAAARTPNLAGAWTAPPGVVQLNFVHRFEMSDAPLRKITNTPTFLVETGLTSRIGVGFVYGSNSTLVPAYPNEWELFARATPLLQEDGAPVSMAAQAGWNVASESVDAELSAVRSVGPLRLIGAGRWFSGAFADEESRFAVAGGAALRLTGWLALAGDYAVLLDRKDDEPGAWSAGVQLGVPYTPHSMSIHASNVGTVTLEGASRGTRTRWGFEYTVPITLRRYAPSTRSGAGPVPAIPPGVGSAPRPRSAESPAGSSAPMRANADTVRMAIESLNYGSPKLEVTPGTTLVWTNRDPLAHTVTADDGSFDSGLIDPGASWSHTFMEPGVARYHCTPHPFMQAQVTVVDAPENTGRER